MNKNQKPTGFKSVGLYESSKRGTIHVRADPYYTRRLPCVLKSDGCLEQLAEAASLLGYSNSVTLLARFTSWSISIQRMSFSFSLRNGLSSFITPGLLVSICLLMLLEKALGLIHSAASILGTFYLLLLLRFTSTLICKVNWLCLHSSLQSCCKFQSCPILHNGDYHHLQSQRKKVLWSEQFGHQTRWHILQPLHIPATTPSLEAFRWQHQALEMLFSSRSWKDCTDEGKDKCRKTSANPGGPDDSAGEL